MFMHFEESKKCRTIL